MIVTCQECDTQFRLDDARVPDAGVRVRCSRCKHAFFVEPPGRASEAVAAEPDPIHQLAAETAAAAAPLLPEPTQDLIAADEEPRAGSADWLEESGGESDWQFNDGPAPQRPPGDRSGRLAAARQAIDDLLGDTGPLEVPAGVGEGPEFAATAEPVERGAWDEMRPTPPDGSVDDGAGRSAASPAGVEADVGVELGSPDLGSPDEWDFGAEEGTEEGGCGAPRPTVGVGRIELVPAGTQGVGLSDDQVSMALEDEPSIVATWLARAANVAGWVLVVFLVGATAWRSLGPPAPILFGPPGTQPVAGLQADELRGRWIENAVAGSVYTVTGRLHNLSQKPTEAPLAVHLLDASGASLAMAVIQSPLRTAELRETDLRGYRRPFGPVPRLSRRAFQALFLNVPAEASAFELGPVPEEAEAQASQYGGGDGVSQTR